ncbi:MAG: ArsR family transcriptional regulator [Betaproteobacteria bacterium]|nr:ArsR family transcriptional regulator [Betaproteobacteria bacterium]
MEEKGAVKKLAALAQESRLRVFRYLVGVGKEGSTPTEISETLQISPTTLSFHLKELLNAGLVTQTRKGRSLHYLAEFAEMAQLLTFLTERCCQGVRCEVQSVGVCE